MHKAICFLFLVITLNVFSLEVPPLENAVNDYASLLTNSEKNELEKVLQKLDEETKIQLALLTIPSLENEEIEEYSIKVVEKWKLGDKKTNSGALLLIARDERKIRIEVGYGLEKDLTDATCSSIIRSIISPAFKSGNYYKGIKEGLFAMIAYAKRDESLIKEVKGKRKKGWDWYSPLILIFVIYVFFTRLFGGNIFWPLIFFTKFSRYNGRYNKRRRNTGMNFGSFSLFDNDSSNNNTFSGKGGSFGGGGASGGW